MRSFAGARRWVWKARHPVEAEEHLRLAEELLAAPRGYETRITRARMNYQFAGVVGQQGKIAEAVAYYRQALALVREDDTALDLQRQVLLYNNLAYQLLLLNDPEAAKYARTGLEFALRKGHADAPILSTLHFGRDRARAK